MKKHPFFQGNENKAKNSHDNRRVIGENAKKGLLFSGESCTINLQKSNPAEMTRKLFPAHGASEICPDHGVSPPEEPGTAEVREGKLPITESPAHGTHLHGFRRRKATFIY